MQMYTFSYEWFCIVTRILFIKHIKHKIRGYRFNFSLLIVLINLQLFHFHLIHNIENLNILL